jgi:SAM-dependent methyltransferase
MTDYVLGHSESELRRLAEQAVLIEPITRRLLVEAGIGPGMRVLDVGSGLGDVSFLAAELVGEPGSVVGVDRAPEALAAARERAEARSLRNVTFEEGDPAELTFSTPFDALIGRYVLMFQADPAAMLRGSVAHVRPGGVVAFHEIDWNGYRSYPPVESWDRCCLLVERTLAASGADTQLGMKLPSLFSAAGLPDPAMRLSALVGAGTNSREGVQRLVGLALTLLPATEELGIAAPGELDPETLERRVTDDAAAAGSVVIGPSELTAWARV